MTTNPTSHAPAADSRAMLGCVSHAPIILLRTKAPEAEPEINALCTQFEAAVARFDPEQIIFFGNNHFAGFHYSNMPPYCIGTACDTVDDLGGFAGKLDVPQESAIALVEHLREEGFDPSISYRMSADHAFSQPLHRLIGSLDRYPVLPIFVSVFTPPYLSFARSRKFGEAVGRYALRSGKRTLLMGTGGLSHNPAHYFPLMGNATPEVHGYQLDGERAGTMSDAQWFERFARMHREGAEALGSGLRTAKDVRLNPALDERVLAHLKDGTFAEMDNWSQTGLIEQAGVGMVEIHSWIAATAGYRQMAPETQLHAFYAQAVEYGGGYGMLYSNAPTPR